jgi:hypothetical protein
MSTGREGLCCTFSTHCIARDCIIEAAAVAGACGWCGRCGYRRRRELYANFLTSGGGAEHATARLFVLERWTSARVSEGTTGVGGAGTGGVGKPGVGDAGAGVGVSGVGVGPPGKSTVSMMSSTLFEAMMSLVAT